jgi:hypothetical protein
MGEMIHSCCPIKLSLGCLVGQWPTTFANRYRAKYIEISRANSEEKQE